MAEPKDWQEIHSPTEAVEIVWRVQTKLEEDGVAQELIRRSQGRQRVADIRLWDGLSELHQQAAMAIFAGYQIRIRGIGRSLDSVELVRRMMLDIHGSGAPAAAEFIDAEFSKWMRLCSQSGIETAVVIDVLCEGFSLRESDRARRKRKGWAKEMVDRGLECFVRDVAKWHLKSPKLDGGVSLNKNSAGSKT